MNPIAPWGGIGSPTVLLGDGQPEANCPCTELLPYPESSYQDVPATFQILGSPSAALRDGELMGRGGAWLDFSRPPPPESGGNLSPEVSLG